MSKFLSCIEHLIERHTHPIWLWMLVFTQLIQSIQGNVSSIVYEDISNYQRTFLHYYLPGSLKQILNLDTTVVSRDISLI